MDKRLVADEMALKGFCPHRRFSDDLIDLEGIPRAQPFIGLGDCSLVGVGLFYQHIVNADAVKMAGAMLHPPLIRSIFLSDFTQLPGLVRISGIFPDGEIGSSVLHGECQTALCPNYPEACPISAGNEIEVLVRCTGGHP